MTKERDEARKRFNKVFEDEKYKVGKEPLHDAPFIDHRDKPHANIKQDKDGNWYAVGWKKDEDTWVEE